MFDGFRNPLDVEFNQSMLAASNYHVVQYPYKFFYIDYKCHFKISVLKYKILGSAYICNSKQALLLTNKSNFLRFSPSIA